MVNVVKQRLRKIVLGRVTKELARVGEDKSLMAASAMLKGTGSISRAALIDCLLTFWNWGRLRKTPDLELFNKLSVIITPLDDVDRANIVFSAAGEGAAWAYLDEIQELAQTKSNRFTREMITTITKARVKNDKLPNLPKRG